MILSTTITLFFTENLHYAAISQPIFLSTIGVKFQEQRIVTSPYLLFIDAIW